MKAIRDSKPGRPKTKGPLRNFKFREEIDEFLTDESGVEGRTGKDMTRYIEDALFYFKLLKPSVRDAELAKVKQNSPR